LECERAGRARPLVMEMIQGEMKKRLS
jgi:hypothetical protein